MESQVLKKEGLAYKGTCLLHQTDRICTIIQELCRSLIMKTMLAINFITVEAYQDFMKLKICKMNRSEKAGHNSKCSYREKSHGQRSMEQESELFVNKTKKICTRISGSKMEDVAMLTLCRQCTICSL
jgi:hypothetical protein